MVEQSMVLLIWALVTLVLAAYLVVGHKVAPKEARIAYLVMRQEKIRAWGALYDGGRGYNGRYGDKHLHREAQAQAKAHYWLCHFFWPLYVIHLPERNRLDFSPDNQTLQLRIKELEQQAGII